LYLLAAAKTSLGGLLRTAEEASLYGQSDSGHTPRLATTFIASRSRTTPLMLLCPVSARSL
jgi:hypothetical protein